jgi:hypothetical protein
MGSRILAEERRKATFQPELITNVSSAPRNIDLTNHPNMSQERPSQGSVHLSEYVDCFSADFRWWAGKD